MDSAQTQKALASAGLSRLAPELAALTQPSMGLTTTQADEAKLAVGGSKFGGLPDMPIGTAWPILNGVAMSFVGQIRLEDARPFDARRTVSIGRPARLLLRRAAADLWRRPERSWRLAGLLLRRRDSAPAH